MAAISCELERERGKRLHLEVLCDLRTSTKSPSTWIRWRSRPPIAPPMCCRGQHFRGVNRCSASRAEPAGHYELLNRRVRTLKEHRLLLRNGNSGHDRAWVEAEGRRMLMLGSGRYLGLLEHPHLKQAAMGPLKIRNRTSRGQAADGNHHAAPPARTKLARSCGPKSRLSSAAAMSPTSRRSLRHGPRLLRHRRSMEPRRHSGRLPDVRGGIHGVRA